MFHHSFVRKARRQKSFSRLCFLFFVVARDNKGTKLEEVRFMWNNSLSKLSDFMEKSLAKPNGGPVDADSRQRPSQMTLEGFANINQVKNSTLRKELTTYLLRREKATQTGLGTCACWRKIMKKRSGRLQEGLIAHTKVLRGRVSQGIQYKVTTPLQWL